MKRLIKTAALIIVIPPAALLAIIFIRALSKPSLNDEYRKEGLGNYIELSRGVTHYEFNDMDTVGPVFVMIHGVTVPMIVWNNTVPALNESGISTLRLDLYGRGYSDRPKAKYNADLYVTQIRELLDSLGIDRPIHLAGVSMGGALAAFAANEMPERVASVTLIDPAVSYRKEEGKRYVWNRLKKGAKAIYAVRRNGEMKRKHADFTPHIRRQFNFRGIEFSLLSMALFGDVENFVHAFRRLSEREIPVQIIWGEADKLLPIALGERLAKEFNDVPFHVIPGGGHTPQYGKAEKVNPILIDFVKQSGLQNQGIEPFFTETESSSLSDHL